MPLGLGAGIERGYEYLAQQDRETENRRRYDQEAARRAQQDEQDRMAKQAQAERQARKDAFERTKFEDLSAYRQNQMDATTGNQQRAMEAHEFNLGQKKMEQQNKIYLDSLARLGFGMDQEKRAFSSGQDTDFKSSIALLNTLAKKHGHDKEISRVLRMPSRMGEPPTFDIEYSSGEKEYLSGDQILQELAAAEELVGREFALSGNPAYASSRRAGTASASGTLATKTAPSKVQVLQADGSYIAKENITEAKASQNADISKDESLVDVGLYEKGMESLDGSKSAPVPKDGKEVPTWLVAYGETLFSGVYRSLAQPTITIDGVTSESGKEGNLIDNHDRDVVTSNLKGVIHSKETHDAFRNRVLELQGSTGRSVQELSGVVAREMAEVTTEAYLNWNDATVDGVPDTPKNFKNPFHVEKTSGFENRSVREKWAEADRLAAIEVSGREDSGKIQNPEHETMMMGHEVEISRRIRKGESHKSIMATIDRFRESGEISALDHKRLVELLSSRLPAPVNYHGIAAPGAGIMPAPAPAAQGNLFDAKRAAARQALISSPFPAKLQPTAPTVPLSIRQFPGVDPEQQLYIGQ